LPGIAAALLLRATAVCLTDLPDGAAAAYSTLLLNKAALETAATSAAAAAVAVPAAAVTGTFHINRTLDITTDTYLTTLIDCC
jgi:stage V sporulation protein SpoVS